MIYVKIKLFKQRGNMFDIIKQNILKRYSIEELSEIYGVSLPNREEILQKIKNVNSEKIEASCYDVLNKNSFVKASGEKCYIKVSKEENLLVIEGKMGILQRLILMLMMFINGILEKINAFFDGLILKIKLKIQESNLTTKVEVAGKEMSVREAIETKYLLENYFTYISNTMQTQMLNAKRKLVQAQQDIEMQQAIAVQDITKSLGKELSSSEIEERAKLTIQLTKETKELSILSFDGVNNAEDSFKTFEASIRNFLEEVDYVLSESNATTTIEV